MQRLVSILLALVLLVGCGGGGEAPAPIEAEGGKVDLDFATGDTAAAQAAYGDFALGLLRESRREGENTLLSPLSVTLALAMVAGGAGGDTAGQFRALLGEGLTPFCRELMARYGDLGGSSETNLVNSLWCDPSLTLSDSFVAVCRDYFDAELFHADLQSADTVRAVNDYVKEATHGMIPAVVDRFDDQAALALINAVYFKNQFAEPFETPRMAWYLDFQNADGTASRPQGMSNGEREERYLSHENGQGVVLPYDDGRLGLLLMLPDEGVGLGDYLDGWDGGTIAALLAGQRETRVALSVPKFKAAWSGELKGALTALGLTDAFDPGRADFTPMGVSADGPLYVGSVIHKTAFEVNEKGTEAAAVTAAVLDCGAAMPPDDLVVLTFDRPFVYGIVDLETGAPLFLGTLERAESAD